MTKLKKLFVCGVVAAVSLGIGLGVHGSDRASAADLSPQLETALVGALAADQGTPGAPFGSVTALSTPPAVEAAEAYVTNAIKSGSTMSPQSLQSAASSLTAIADKVLAAHFTGNALAGEKGRESNLQKGAVDPNIMQLGGGISGLKVSSATLSDGSAHIIAIAHDWSISAVHQPTGVWAVAEPVNDVQYTIDMSTDGSTWVVNNLSWKFVTAP